MHFNTTNYLLIEVQKFKQDIEDGSAATGLVSCLLSFNYLYLLSFPNLLSLTFYLFIANLNHLLLFILISYSTNLYYCLLTKSTPKY